MSECLIYKIQDLPITLGDDLHLVLADAQEHYMLLCGKPTSKDVLISSMHESEFNRCTKTEGMRFRCPRPPVHYQRPLDKCLSGFVSGNKELLDDCTFKKTPAITKVR